VLPALAAGLPLLLLKITSCNPAWGLSVLLERSRKAPGNAEQPDLRQIAVGL